MLDTKPQSDLVRTLIGIVLIFTDILAMMFFGVIMIFFYYFILGLNKKNLLLYAPSIATEVAATHVFFYTCVTGYPKIVEWCARQSRYVVFAAYFSANLAISFVSVFFQCLILSYVWYDRPNYTRPDYGLFIGIHQLLTFVLTTSHSILANYHFFKGVDPFAGGVCCEIITWVFWGIWIGNALGPISNIDQMGGYIQWIPIINLMSHGIFKNANMAVFKDDITKFGLMFLGTQVPIIICYTLAFIFDRLVIVPGPFNAASTGHHVWSFAALAWLPFQITGTRLAPIYYDRFCKTPSGGNRWIRMFIWVVIFIAISAPICGVFYCTDGSGNALPTGVESWPARPAYFYGFGMGILYAVWFETLHISRDGVGHGHGQVQSQVKKSSDLERELEVTQSHIQSIH